MGGAIILKYPLKFNKVLIEKVWGGRNLNKILDIKLPSHKNYGESWEIASHKNGMSIVENGKLKGKTLDELIKEYQGKFLGEEVYKKYQNKFPLLIKYLDINDKLSVQVHPNDDYALKNEGEFGKRESWYVIDASEDAKLIMGIKNDINFDTLKEKLEKNTFENLFEIIKVKKGDFIDIKPGMVHASLKGRVLICEIQQNSDSTYRIYDFDRLVNGEKRDLHLEKALDVINLEEKANIINKESGILIKNNYYKVEKLNIKEEFIEEGYNNFMIYSVINGFGFIEYKEGSISIKKGETYLIPAKLRVKLKGNLEVIKTWI